MAMVCLQDISHENLEGVVLFRVWHKSEVKGVGLASLGGGIVSAGARLQEIFWLKASLNFLG